VLDRLEESRGADAAEAELFGRHRARIEKDRKLLRRWSSGNLPSAVFGAIKSLQASKPQLGVVVMFLLMVVQAVLLAAERSVEGVCFRGKLLEQIFAARFIKSGP
jgi:hypothetical protein